MKIKYLITACLIVLASLSPNAQSAMGEVKNGQVNYSVRSFATELMLANHNSEQDPVAVVFLKDAQQRVCANLYFYAGDIMSNQQASRDRDTGLVEDHYSIDYFELILAQLKDRALKHNLLYDLDSNTLVLQTQLRSSGVKSGVKTKPMLGGK